MREYCQYIYQKPHTKAGEQCGNSPVLGGEYCQRHGGGEPFKGKPRGYKFWDAQNRFLVVAKARQIMKAREGRYGEHVPKSIANDYVVEMQDAEILNITDDLALVNARIKQLLRRVDIGDKSLASWQEVADEFRTLEGCMRNFDTVGSNASRRKLRKMLLEEREQDREAWDEIFERMDQRIKMTESERKRRVDMETLYTAQEMMDKSAQLLAAIGEALNDTVGDNDDLKKRIFHATARRFADLTGSGDNFALDNVGRRGEVVAGPR